MASTYNDLCAHVVFATKERRPTIASSYRDRLHAFLAGTLRVLNAVPLEIGGVEDHVHLLIGTRPDHRLSDLVREAKKVSNGWMRDEAGVRDFAWQEGYAAFSVGLIERAAVAAYIRGQESHHRKRSSQDELRDLLEEHGIPIDERYFV